MAVLNSNLTRFLLIASLFLSACTNLGTTANELIENSGVQDVADASESSDEVSNEASVTEGEEEVVLQETPTLNPEIESTSEAAPTEATTEEEVEPTATVEPTKEPTVEPTEEPSPTPEPEPTEAPPPEPTPLPVSITSNTADMLLIEGGEFEMGAEATQLLEECNAFRDGCEEGWFLASEPIHLVQVDPFYLDVYEITNEAFLEFLNELDDIESGCAGQLCFDADDSQLEVDADGQYTVDESFFEHPITGVTWYGASSFCEWRDARLATEAEWELAASWNSAEGTKNIYPWGDEFIGTNLNYCDINCAETQAATDFDDGFALTAPVGSYEEGRSPAGVYDMGGNVWEWVNDWLGDDYYRESPEANPQGPEDGDGKVVRGGSWIDTGNFSATTIRFPAPPQESGDTIGFRCVVDAVPAEEVLAQAPEDESGDEATEEMAEEASEEVTDEAADEEASEEVAEEMSDEETAEEETAEEVTEEMMDEAAEETADEETSEDVAEEVADDEAAEEVTEEMADEESEEAAEADASDAPVSINCDLQPGIDKGSTYIVGACDWLEKIANRLGVAYHALLAANPQIDDPNLIYPGQVLNVPGREGQSGPPPPANRPPGQQGPPFSGAQPPGGGLGN